MKSMKGNIGFIICIVLALSLFCGIFTVQASGKSEEIRIELETLSYTKNDDSIRWEIPYSSDIFPDGVESLANVQLQNTANFITADINVTDAGIYFISLGYLKETDGTTIEMYVDGTKLQNNVDTYNAGGWQAGCAVMGYINLTAGTHTLKFKCIDSASTYHMMLDYLLFNPFKGEQSEFLYEFEGNIYTKSKDSIWLESNYTHDLLPVPAVVFTELQAVGEYIETESLLIPETGKYNITLGYILDAAHDTVQISIDGKNVGDPINAKHEGGWEAAEKELADIELSEGVHKIRITAVSGDSGKFAIRLDYLKLKLTETEKEPSPAIPGEGETTPGQSGNTPGKGETGKPDTPITGDAGIVAMAVIASAMLLTVAAILRIKVKH